jgi:hypothetical protein
MWNVLKFFFVWFWLGVAAFIGAWALAAYTAPTFVVDPRTGIGLPGQMLGLVLGCVLAVFMCIPAYFIARPHTEV